MNPIIIKLSNKSLALTPIEIKILLLRAGLTITQLAARIGYPREMVSRTISGSTRYPELTKKTRSRAC